MTRSGPFFVALALAGLVAMIIHDKLRISGLERDRTFLIEERRSLIQQINSLTSKRDS